MPLYIVRKQRLLRYWINIVTNKPNMVFDIYKILVTDCNNGKVNWATNIPLFLTGTANRTTISTEKNNFEMKRGYFLLMSL